MPEAINHTHDITSQSWVDSAHVVGTDFPLQNLPFAVFRRAHTDQNFRCGVAIGDQVIDLAALHQINVSHAAKGSSLFGVHTSVALQAASQPRLNGLMALGQTYWHSLRVDLFDALTMGSSHQSHIQACLIPMSEVQYSLPAQIGDYTDFYTSIYHATNIGKQFRPDNPLLPNYKWVPIGYHGRASSILISGHDFHRPKGQIKAPDAEQPKLAPSQRVDIELELGVFVGQGNPLGQAIDLNHASEHVFGLCLLNDWSARDIQGWEYQPLGPFLSKNFATTISPWVVTLEALAPYRGPVNRPESDPDPLPYLDSPENRQWGAYDIELKVALQTPMMRQAGLAAAKVSQTSYKHAYWSLAQMVTHHTVNGCPLVAGDLLGTGTLSGPTLDQAGAFIELTQGGNHPITLPNGESRTFLQDGDTVTLTGWCTREGYATIGFGSCVGTVLPANP